MRYADLILIEFSVGHLNRARRLLSLVGHAIFAGTCRGGGMADATDLKSVDRKVVRVRLPPSAPIFSIVYGQQAAI